MTDDYPSMIAIDLGAESCRVSLLEWNGENPQIDLVYRFSNAPVAQNGELHWDLDRICSELNVALHRCAERASKAVSSLGVDGWAVDYVRLREDGSPISAPYCYRDPRTEAAEAELEKRISAEELFARSGVQPLRINTLYQLVADQLAGMPASTPWVNLPEYVLMWLGGSRIAEYTNATHTGLVSAKSREWNREIFERCGLDVDAAPPLTATSFEAGHMQQERGGLAVLRETKLVAPCCHDTASAVAGIPVRGEDCAYLSSGTWSLVGALLQEPINSHEAFASGFTNLGAPGGQVCFHKNVNGMWLLKQCAAQLCPQAEGWSMAELIAAAERLPIPDELIDVDDADLLLHGRMASRINAQLARRGVPSIEEHPAAMPRYASLIFHSLAARYAEVLQNVAAHSGKKLKRLCVVGGGSQNHFLNRLTEEATGLEVVCGMVESSTIGNFAAQLAAHEGAGQSADRIAHWAGVLTRL